MLKALMLAEVNLRFHCYLTYSFYIKQGTFQYELQKYTMFNSKGKKY